MDLKEVLKPLAVSCASVALRVAGVSTPEHVPSVWGPEITS